MDERRNERREEQRGEEENGGEGRGVWKGPQRAVCTPYLLRTGLPPLGQREAESRTTFTHKPSYLPRAHTASIQIHTHTYTHRYIHYTSPAFQLTHTTVSFAHTVGISPFTLTSLTDLAIPIFSLSLSLFISHCSLLVCFLFLSLYSESLY